MSIDDSSALRDLDHLLCYVRDILGLVLLNFFLRSTGGCFFGGRILFPALGFLATITFCFPQGFYVILHR